jgi:hypothetical protein
MLVGFPGILLLQAHTDKPNFSGTWLLEASKSSARVHPSRLMLIIEQDVGEIHISERAKFNTERITEFTCCTLGKDCPMLDSRATKLGFYL